MSVEPYLLTIPVEIIEYILTLLAADGEPLAIAALATTCRLLYKMVYKSSDSHLWREIFLTTFDDPRPARRIAYGQEIPFDWGTEYRRRIWTERYIRSLPVDTERPPNLRFRAAYTLPCNDDLSDFPHCSVDANLRALDAILSALDTAATLPPAPDLLSSPSLGFISWLLSHDLDPGLDTGGPTPPAPSADLEPDYATHPSRNIAWVRALLAGGLPRAWAARLMFPSGAAWERTREGQAMCKLLCTTGWLPRPQPASMADVEALAAAGAFAVERWRDEREERVHVRDNARRRVYNMRYPRAVRGWGPFLPYYEESPYIVDEEDEGGEEMDSDDGEWCSGEQGCGFLDEDGAFGPEEDVVKRVSAAFRIPSHSLIPDWAFLASVRIVIDANMRENGWEGLNGISELDAVRIGRWPAERKVQESGGECLVGEGEKPKMPKRKMGRKPTASSIEGWDWAGVEGIWRRCVCWLDYRDLYDQNHNSMFSNVNGLEEVAIIVPFRLYITHYTPSPLCTSDGTNRPTIHVEGHAFTLEGEISDAVWESDKGTRAMWGTVSTCADGSIRWCMYSSTQDDPNEAEWISEGVQVGLVGSGTGVVGMWTGVKHLIDDPIGAWWQWRAA